MTTKEFLTQMEAIAFSLLGSAVFVAIYTVCK